MSEPVITIDGIGKKYRLGMTLSPNTLRDHLTESVRKLWSRARRGDGRAAPAAPAAEPADAARISGRDFWALKDVSFDVRRGEVVGIIGRNGAGKSTLLKILSRITAPTEGEIRIRGRVASLLEVGTGFHPELSGRENIFLNGAILGMARTEIRRKFDDIVEFADIAAFLETPVKRYSSGMYVRLAFAVAAHLDPEILIVDEVLAVGDVRFQDRCLRKMEQVSQSGRTVLLVSHNMVSVAALCQRCCLLEAGRLVADGPTQEVISEYLLGGGDADASVDLRETPNRTGSGAARVVRARLVDGNGRESREFTMGDSLAIEFDVEFAPPGRKAIFAFTLTTAQGVRLVNWVSTDSGCPIRTFSGTVTVRASLPRLPFYPGIYVIERFWVGDPTRAECFDEVQPLLSLKVSQSPELRERQLSQRMGLVHLPVEASIVAQDSLSPAR